MTTTHLSRTLMASLAALTVFMLSACGLAPNTSRLGMVVDEKTGLLFGSAIEDNVVTDATFYSNKSLKVRTRNTSGDQAFDLDGFTNDLKAAYGNKGYTPINDDGPFGLLMDVNVMYSGQVQTNQTAQFSVVGGLLGATYGGATQRGRLTGLASGAALGQIVGTFPTEDTYMIVAQVTFGVVKKRNVSKRRVTFARSEKISNLDDPKAEEKVYARGFKKTFTTQFTVYAGGRNLKQSEIAEQVRQRAVRIAADFI